MNKKWDLSTIYKNEDEYTTDFLWLKSKIEDVSDYRGKLNTKENILNYFRFSNELDKIFSKLVLYVSLHHDIDLDNDMYLSKQEDLMQLSERLGGLSAFVGPELKKIDDDFILSLQEQDEFKNYKFDLDGIRKSKKHILSEEVEYAFSLVDGFSGGFSQIYDCLSDLELSFEPVIVDGKEVELTQNNFVYLLTNDNRDVRRQAYKNYYKVMKQFHHTLANCYINDLKAESCDLKLRNYDSYLNACFESEEIPVSVYYKLLEMVNKNNILIQKYYRFVGKAKGYTDFGFEDIYTSAYTLNNIYTIEQQVQIILKVFEVFGSEYVEHIKYLIENRLDVDSAPNKSGGAYCTHLYDYGEWVLLNNNNDYSSLSTLAHELGHAMHSYYSCKTQPYEFHEYSIFIAEIASTLNEFLLLDYMIKNVEKDKERLFYLEKGIESIKSTIFRQTMFSEFEEFAHAQVEKKLPVTPEYLTNKYAELLNKYFGDSIIIDENIKYEWLRVPHFYRPYYVYKYATSYIVAINIGIKILSGDKNELQKYLELLKSGGKDYPNTLLNNMGIYLDTDEPYLVVMDYLNKLISEIEKQ